MTIIVNIFLIVNNFFSIYGQKTPKPQKTLKNFFPKHPQIKRQQPQKPQINRQKL